MLNAAHVRMALTGALLGIAALLPSSAGAADRIAYTCNFDICVIDPGAPLSTPVNLTSTLAYTEADPVWAPDGSRIAYRSNYPTTAGGGYFDIWTTDPAMPGTGLDVTQTSDRAEATPTFSPDGTRLAMGADIPSTGASHIYVSPAGGTSAPVSIGATAANDSYPTWSPDGTRLAFARGSGSIIIAPADGSGPGAPLAGGAGLQPAWSPDGTRIAARGPNPGGIYPLVRVVKTDGSGSYINLAANTNIYDTPAWSPDSKRLAWVTPDEHIHVAPSDGSAPGIDIPGTSGVLHNPAWSPDGTRVAFDAADSMGYSQIVVAPADGSQNPVAITAGAYSSSQPVWKPGPPPAGGGGGGGGTGGSGGGSGGSGATPTTTTPTPPTVPAPTPTRAPLVVQFAHIASAHVVNGFMLGVFVSCSAGATPSAVAAGCKFNGSASVPSSGSTPILPARASAKSKKHARAVLFATGSVTVPVSQTKQLRLKLTSAGRKLIAKHRRLRITVAVKVSGGSTQIKTVYVTAPRKH